MLHRACIYAQYSVSRLRAQAARYIGFYRNTWKLLSILRRVSRAAGARCIVDGRTNRNI